MHIDEFIEKYTELEVDKIQRRDVVERFNNKLMVQDISANLSTF